MFDYYRYANMRLQSKITEVKTDHLVIIMIGKTVYVSGFCLLLFVVVIVAVVVVVIVV